MSIKPCPYLHHRSDMTLQQGGLALMHWNSSVVQFLTRFLIVYIVYLIAASKMHKKSSMFVTFGLISIKIFITGPEPVYSVNDLKFTDISGHPWVCTFKTLYCTIWKCSYRYSGSPATLQRLHLSVNLHRSFHPLARDSADQQHYSRDCGTGFCPGMDF